MRNFRYPYADRFDVTALLPAFLIILLAILLTGCGARTVVRDRPTPISVPVIQKCASERPVAIVPLKRSVPDAQWNALSPKQKAELTEAQAYRRMNHSDEQAAATSAC